MSFSEVYNALQLNTLDGQENPVDVPATNNFYEVQKYISATNHIADAWIVGMNTNKLNGLTENQQNALHQAAEGVPAVVCGLPGREGRRDAGSY